MCVWRVQNCFYRSYIASLFQLFVEGGVKSKDASGSAGSPLQAEYERVRDFLAGSKDRLLALG